MELASVLQSAIYHYGPFALLPLLMVEGPLMAIAGGFLVGTGSVSLLLMYVAYLISDTVMTHVYYFAGSSTRTIFDSIADRFRLATTTGQRRQTVAYLDKKLRDNFELAYSVTKFIPIPYSTITATILSGGMQIKYTRFARLIAVLIPLQGVVFISIGYLIAQGILNRLTPERIFGLIAVGIIVIMALFYRQQIITQIKSFKIDEDPDASEG